MLVGWYGFNEWWGDPRYDWCWYAAVNGGGGWLPKWYGSIIPLLTNEEREMKQEKRREKKKKELVKQKEAKLWNT